MKMKKEEIDEIKANAHHPREATLFAKNTLQTHVGAILIARKNKLQHLCGGITLIALVITMVLHYYYCIKYSNSNGFLEAMI